LGKLPKINDLARKLPPTGGSEGPLPPGGCGHRPRNTGGICHHINHMRKQKRPQNFSQKKSSTTANCSIFRMK
jgi:hypothetical protein